MQSARRIRLFNTTPLANFTARLISRQLTLGEAREKVLRFGFDIVFSWLSGMLLVSGLSLLLGCFWEGVSAVVSSFLLRGFSAGAHCSTSGRCAILTAVVYSIIGKIASTIGGGLSLAVLGSTYVVILVLVLSRARVVDPRDVRNRKFRPLAVLLVATYFLVSVRLMHRGVWTSVVPAIALGCLWQSFTITELGRRLVTRIDAILARAGVD